MMQGWRWLPRSCCLVCGLLSLYSVEQLIALLSLPSISPLLGSCVGTTVKSPQVRSSPILMYMPSSSFSPHAIYSIRAFANIPHWVLLHARINCLRSCSSPHPLILTHLLLLFRSTAVVSTSYLVGMQVSHMHVTCMHSTFSLNFLEFKTCLSAKGARWPSELERWTGDRVVQGSNPTAATYSLWNFGNSVYTALPVSFGGDAKSRRSTSLHWKCVTCRGLHHPLLETTHHHGPHWK